MDHWAHVEAFIFTNFYSKDYSEDTQTMNTW